MAKGSLATKTDIASLFQELEDASRQAKIEQKKNKAKTESQVVELDGFLSSVQEVVKVTQNENTPINTPIEPIQEITEPKSEDTEDREDRKDETPTELVETSDTETKALSEEDEDKLNAFSGLMESFGAILDEPPEVEDKDALKLQVQDIYPPSKPKIDESAKIEALESLFSKLSGINPQPKIVEKTKPEIIEKIETPEEISTPIIVSETPPDMKEALSRVKDKSLPTIVSKTLDMTMTEALSHVKDKPLPTKEETIKATQELITNVVDNLDDMKGKTEVKEQINEIDALRKEFNALQQQVRQSSTYIGSGSGSGEVRLEFLDDVQRSTAKVDGKFLKYSSSDGKFVGDDASATQLDNVTAGTVAASKAVVVDSNKDITGFRNVTIGGNLTVSGTTTTIDSATINVVDTFVFEGSTDNAFETSLTVTDPTADRTVTIQDATTTLVGRDTTDTLTNKTLTAPTLTGTAVMADLDISGDVDVDGTLEADAITVNSTTLAEYISDTAGGMFSSNTETGISATYQDGDNTIDLELDVAQTSITSIYNSSLAIGHGSSHANIDFSTDNRIVFDIDGTSQVLLLDGVFRPTTDSDLDLGASAKYFKDAYIDTITTTGNVTIGGDLTITGDDLFMGTNTDGYVLVADGTNYNPVAVSGDIAITNAGVTSIASGVVVNADISGSAAIAFSKMENLTASRALVSDGSGDVSVSAVTSTELGYLDGVSSAIQTQLDAKTTATAAADEATALGIALG